MTEDQQRELAAVNYFALNLSIFPYPKYTVTEDPEGLTPEEAYFKLTKARPVKKVKTTDAGRLRELMWGHMVLNWHINHWKVDIKQGILSEDEIKEWYAEQPAITDFILQKL